MNLISTGVQDRHMLVLTSTTKGNRKIVRGEADRPGIPYEEMERRLEPTSEQKEKPRMKHEERDRRNALRLDAVRRAYWDNTDKSDPDLSVFSDALSMVGIVTDPTVQQQRLLFMMLPADVFGQGVSWGFSATEVRSQIRKFVVENRDAVARVVSG